MISWITFALFFLASLLFFKRKRILIGIGAALFALISLYPVSRQAYKSTLRKELRRVSHLTLDEEANYTDVSEWIRLRKKLKRSLSYRSEREEHLRLAEVELKRPALGATFHALAKHPPKWMISEIENTFAFFEPKTLKTFREMEQKLLSDPDHVKHYLFVKYKIKNNQLYFKDYANNHNTLKYMNGALTRLLRTVELPDMEFLISFHDSLDLEDLPFPIFVHCKRKENPFMALMPDHESISGFESLDAKIDKASASHPWHEKQDVVFWRGSTTSGGYEHSDWRTHLRSKLVFSAQNHPKDLDIKFTRKVLGAKENPELENYPELFAEFIYPEDHLQYRYLMDADGNASTYTRLYWILRSNSTAIKHDSPFTMWFHPLLRPYEHYIPVKGDFSDLKEKLDWARAHPEEAKAIAEKSTRLTKEEMTLDHAYLYLYLTLKHYGKLFGQ